MNGPSADGVGMYGDDDVEADAAGNADYDHNDSDLADGESDDLLDDDLMDKISSSPSIDDGMFSRCITRWGFQFNDEQRTLISNSSTRSTTLSQLSMGKRMLRREILWCFWTTATATGGWFVW